MVRGWRIVSERRRDDAFTGEGARRFGARWNSPGNAMVYLSEHRSLAALEVMVQRRTFQELAQHFLLFEATWEDGLMGCLSASALPEEWREQRPTRSTVNVGDAWIREVRSAVLAVPSAIIPEELNYLLNPAHPDFRRIHIGKPTVFTFDPRLVN